MIEAARSSICVCNEQGQGSKGQNKGGGEDSSELEGGQAKK